MKTIQVKSHFKKVSDKSSARYGEKRPDLHWSYQGIEETDFATMSPEVLSQVATLANATLESYGRKLLLQNTDDWYFDPSEHVSIASAFADLTSVVTRKRKVTKESLAKCGAFYAAYAGELLDKDSKASSAGEKVIANKLQPIAANTQALEVMKANILALIDAAAIASESNIKLAEDLENNADCLEWIVAECDSLIEASQIDMSDML